MPLPGHQVSHEAVVGLGAHETLPFEDLAPFMPRSRLGAARVRLRRHFPRGVLTKLNLGRAAVAVMPYWVKR